MKKIVSLLLFVPFVAQSFKVDFSDVDMSRRPSEVMDAIIKKIEPEIKKAAQKSFAAIAYFYNQVQGGINITPEKIELLEKLSQIESPYPEQIVETVFKAKRQEIKEYCHKDFYPGMHNDYQGDVSQFAQCVMDQYKNALKASKAGKFLKEQREKGLVTRDGRIPGYWDTFKRFLGFTV